MAGPEFEVGPLVDPSIIVERAFREFAMEWIFPLEAAARSSKSSTAITMALSARRPSSTSISKILTVLPLPNWSTIRNW